MKVSRGNILPVVPIEFNGTFCKGIKMHEPRILVPGAFKGSNIKERTVCNAKCINHPGLLVRIILEPVGNKIIDMHLILSRLYDEPVANIQLEFEL